MELYASMRFTLVCVRATRLPTVIVATAMYASMAGQPAAEPALPGSPKTPIITRTRAPKAAAFTTTLMYEVVEVGAPS
jgi:hypothetical protein